MSTPNSVRAEVAQAFRLIAAEYRRLPAQVRDELDLSWNGTDLLVDRQLLDGDRDAAIAAIATWENHYLDLFENAVVDATLTETQTTPTERTQ